MQKVVKLSSTKGQLLRAIWGQKAYSQVVRAVPNPCFGDTAFRSIQVQEREYLTVVARLAAHVTLIGQVVVHDAVVRVNKVGGQPVQFRGLIGSKVHKYNTRVEGRSLSLFVPISASPRLCVS